MNSDVGSAVAHAKELVGIEFAKHRALNSSDARALEIVAIELELSLADCAAVIGREDLLGGLGKSWKIELPATNSPELRRP